MQVHFYNPLMAQLGHKHCYRFKIFYKSVISIDSEAGVSKSNPRWTHSSRVLCPTE